MDLNPDSITGNFSKVSEPQYPISKKEKENHDPTSRACGENDNG